MAGGDEGGSYGARDRRRSRRVAVDADRLYTAGRGQVDRLPGRQPRIGVHGTWKGPRSKRPIGLIGSIGETLGHGLKPGGIGGLEQARAG